MTQKRTKIKIKCHYCGKIFNKDLSEYNRNKKLKRNNYCSLFCCGKINYKNLGESNLTGNTNNLVCGNRRDEYTGFRDHLRRAKKRSKECNIVLDDLLEQWNKQNGICIYTGVKLKYPNYRNNNDYIYTASLDRIDSNYGYIKNNIQFISISANYAKSRMTHEKMIKFCKIITNYWTNKNNSQ